MSLKLGLGQKAANVMNPFLALCTLNHRFAFRRTRTLSANRFVPPHCGKNYHLLSLTMENRTVTKCIAHSTQHGEEQVEIGGLFWDLAGPSTPRTTALNTAHYGETELDGWNTPGRETMVRIPPPPHYYSPSSLHPGHRSQILN